MDLMETCTIVWNGVATFTFIKNTLGWSGNLFKKVKPRKILRNDCQKMRNAFKFKIFWN